MENSRNKCDKDRHEVQRQVEIAEIHRLREAFTEYQNTGDLKNIETEDLKKIQLRLQSAGELLVMFPGCDSTRFWCLTQANSLDSVIRARTRKW